MTGVTHITLNNRVIDAQDFSPFSLVEAMTGEMRSQSKLSRLNVPPATATQLLTGISLQTSSAATSPRIDLASVPIEWLNNLTSDARYR